MTENLVIPVILKIMAFFLFSELLYTFYSRISNPKFDSNQNFDASASVFYNFKLLSQVGEKSSILPRSFASLIPIMSFIGHIFALIMMPISMGEFSYTSQFSFFIFWLIIGTSPLLKILLAITSEHPAKIQTSRELASKIVHYYLALLISFISILIIVVYSSLNSRVLNLESIIDYQKENTLFLIINPFSFFW